LLGGIARADPPPGAILVGVGPKEAAFALSQDGERFEKSGETTFCPEPAEILQTKCSGGKLYFEVNRDVAIDEDTGGSGGSVPAGVYDVLIEGEDDTDLSGQGAFDAHVLHLLEGFPALHPRVWKKIGACLRLVGTPDETQRSISTRMAPADFCDASEASQRRVFILSLHGAEAESGAMPTCPAATPTSRAKLTNPHGDLELSQLDSLMRTQALSLTQLYVQRGGAPPRQHSPLLRKAWILPDAGHLVLQRASGNGTEPVSRPLHDALAKYQADAQACEELQGALAAAALDSQSSAMDRFLAGASTPAAPQAATPGNSAFVPERREPAAAPPQASPPPPPPPPPPPEAVDLNVHRKPARTTPPPPVANRQEREQEQQTVDPQAQRTAGWVFLGVAAAATVTAGIVGGVWGNAYGAAKPFQSGPDSYAASTGIGMGAAGITAVVAGVVSAVLLSTAPDASHTKHSTERDALSESSP
jgi:hypothetical protein